MDVLTISELMTGLLSVIGTGILLLLATSRSPKPLHDEIARRVEHSIALLDTCKDSRSR
ncbi:MULTISPECIES: hypothetical protein [unclassified Variovorax]|uniref:hypothetical protein n=1 Tax=unclassified Variovorax TaxID=663243 RepID=UPI00076C76B8|nr:MULTISPECIES: hypothetical protein [unclassified Variovorax]KWT84348.1 hypothetical protein APY03_4208 [Variovorax sp. WDL1]PNG52839.1 hypothetical protein CHC07_05215 [Variovorax sp. B4]PNG55376.1 hypothetical protein CHC06_04178 [Variovorax sp. B2]VTV09132.1 hypothetical protein WDL1CHR_00294 [Variovorax sp. WDL1]